MTNLSLQKKSAARMAAVQFRFERKINQDNLSLEDYIKRYKSDWTSMGNEDEGLLPNVEPDYKLLEKILAGIEVASEPISTKLNAALTESWNVDRVQPLIIAILECAIYELNYSGKNAPIIINEYVNLAASFFDEKEIAYFNATLDTLASELPRPLQGERDA